MVDDLLVDVERVVDVTITTGFEVEEIVAEAFVGVGVVIGANVDVLDTGAGSSRASTQ